MTVNAQAVVPKDEQDPTKQDGRVSRCQADFNRRLNAAYRLGNDVIKELDYTVVKLNESAKYILNKDSFYNYNIDAQEKARVSDWLAERIRELFMVSEDGLLVRADNARELWLMTGYVQPAYTQGTSAAVTNLTLQSPAYATAVYDPEQIFLTPEYQRRVELVAGREFELMEDFTADVINETRKVLSDGIIYGDSPRTISKKLRDRIGVKKSRADTIARTEITGALRQANRDEGKSADAKYGIKSKYLWMASFLPNVRPSHLSRSGNLHTAESDEAFYRKDGNAIRCRCTQIIVVLDDDGQPLSTGAIDKVQKMKASYTG